LHIIENKEIIQSLMENKRVKWREGAQRLPDREQGSIYVPYSTIPIVTGCWN